MRIAVVNASTQITPAEASLMTRACAWQANHHIAEAWRIDPPSVVHIPAGDPVPDDAIVALIADTADTAGALGYHDQAPNGRPYMRIFVGPTLASGGTILGADEPGALSVSTVLSHEIAEYLGDPECNRWAQRADGRLICLELGDPVQGSSYPVVVTTGKRKDRVLVTNFVHPAWFDTAPEPGARFDQLGHITGPFTLEAGGYQIWTDGSRYGNEFGARATLVALQRRAADKLHPAARTRRRYEALEKLGAVADRFPTVADRFPTVAGIPPE